MSAKAKLAESTFSSLQDMMTAYAAEATRMAWEEHHRRLDFSEASIEILEQILEGQSAADLEFQSRLWGAYFGEFLRQRYAGEWELSQYPGEASGQMASQAPQLVPAVVVRGSRLYPLLKVSRRLSLGLSENLAVFYKMVAERLDNPPKPH